MLNFRRILLWSLLCIWALVALGRAAYLAGPARAEHMRQVEVLAGQEGVVPAERGRLLDRNRVPIAWDEARFELLATDGWDSGCAASVEAILKRPIEIDDSRVIAHQLHPDEATALEELARTGFPIKIRYRRERIVAVSGAKRDFVAQLEAKYEERLRGKDGRYRILVDRNQQEIPESWQLLVQPENGQDVVLDISLEELETK